MEHWILFYLFLFYLFWIRVPLNKPWWPITEGNYIQKSKFTSTVKKQKDVTHKTQIFQEAQKTKTLNKKQIHMEPRGEFQKIPKIV